MGTTWPDVAHLALQWVGVLGIVFIVMWGMTRKYEPMCKWGTNTIVRAKVAAHLSSTGQEKWRNLRIDSCIAPIVKALQDGGIDMLSSCCGHGKWPGEICLADGRVLIIAKDMDEAERLQYRPSSMSNPPGDQPSAPPVPPDPDE